MEVVAALNRLLDNERKQEIKVAAVSSLVQLYAAGCDDAIREVLSVLLESRETPEMRTAALGLLRYLRPSQRRSVLKQLEADPRLHRRAEKLLRDADRDAELDGTMVAALVKQLGAEDYSRWNDAVQRLSMCGPAIIQPLADEMQSRAHDPEYCVRAGMALKTLGPRRGQAVADAIRRLEEPIPLQVLVEVIGALGQKSLIYQLEDLIDRLGDPGTRSVSSDGFAPMQRVRAKAHLELARIGSRVAIRDLRNALTDPDQRLELELVRAVEWIGKRDEIGLLLRVHGREDPFVRQRIAEAVRAIMKRERIRRNNRMFLTLNRAQRRALETILPPPRRRTDRRP